MKKIFRSLILAPILSLCLSSVSFAVTPTIDDVSQEDWYHNYFVCAYHCGIIRGTSDDSLKFEPNRSVTRAEFVTMIGRMHEISGEKIADQNYTDPYKDTEDSYYTPYVAWATEMNIVQGYGNGYFGPNDPLTREQMVLVIYNYIETYDLFDLFEEYYTYEFSDLEYISLWALFAVNRTRQLGIICGDPGNMFRPKYNSTRAEGVKIVAVVTSTIYDLATIM